MNDAPAPLHRFYLHYSELPYSLRVLYTCALLVLALAYLFAGIYLYHTYAGRAGGNPLILTYEDIVVAYSGSGKTSRIESALRGPMSSMLPRDEMNTVIAWVERGSDRALYETAIKPILDQRCMACHDGSNPHLPNLNGYDNLKKVTEIDTGTGIFTLVRVSHIHLFGLSFVFFIMGLIFSHAFVRPVWFKCLVVGAPFLGLVLDVSSWYFTKLFHPFAWVVISAGAVMARSFVFMWFVSIYQMWLSGPPEAVAKRGEGTPRVLG
jgi:hypothetical protein